MLFFVGLGPSDSEAGPDIADEEFRPGNEVFKDPNAFDFLSQHGKGSTSAANLARESLYVKFDPLIAGRASIMPPRYSYQNISINNSKQLIPLEFLQNK